MQDNLAVAFRPRLGRPTAVSFDGVPIGSAIQFQRQRHCRFATTMLSERVMGEEVIALGTRMMLSDARYEVERFGSFIVIDHQELDSEDRFVNPHSRTVEYRIVVVTTYHMELDRLDADRHPTFS